MTILSPRSKVEADILTSFGSLHAAKVELAAALHSYQRAFNIYQRLGLARDQAVILLCISTLYGDAIDYASALKYVDQAIVVQQADPDLLMMAYNNRAVALQELRRYPEAEAGYRRALVLARRLRNTLIEAHILGNIARVRLKLGDVAAAERVLAEADGLAARGEAASVRPQLVAVAAQAALQRRDYPRAAALIAERFRGVDLARTDIGYREAHRTAYETYRALGDPRLAVAHLAALKRLDDEATALATSANSALAAARFDYDNQQLRIATLQRDEATRAAAAARAQARTQRFAFLVIAAAAAVGAGLLVLGILTLRRSRDQVRAAAADLSDTNRALNKALAAKTEFLATTSHEIRTPLNGILGMTQVMLADHGLPPDTRERIGVVHGAGVTMRALVDDILDLAKIETGKLTVERAPFDLAATLAEAGVLWRGQAEVKGVGFRLDLADCPGLIEGDAARVRQVAFNLLSNALKFTDAGEVALAAAAAGDTWRLTVSDTGIGIAPGQLEAIFESFRQADAGTTRRFGGTGLGLSISRDLARAMGGDVAVASVPGAGSTFTVTLPLVLAAAAPRGATPAGLPCDGTLVIDANPITRAKLAALVGRRDACVVAVGSVTDALLRGPARLALVDGGAFPDPASVPAALARLLEGVEEAVLLWKGEPPAVPAGVRVVAKPVGGTALLDELFGTATQRDGAAALVQRAA